MRRLDTRLGAMLAIAAAVLVAVVVGTRVIGGETTNPAAGTGSSATPGMPASSPVPRSLQELPLLDLAQSSHPTGRMDNSAVGSGFGSVWVGSLDGGVVVRLDADDGSRQAEIHFDDEAQEAEICGALQASGRSIWFQTCGTGPGAGRARAETVRLDPEANRIIDVYEDGGPDGVGIGPIGDQVWFISDAPTGQLTAVDDASGTQLDTLELGSPVTHLAGGFDSLWVSPDGAAELWRIDPDDGERLAAIPLSAEPGFIAVAADSVWVALPEAGQLVRIDPGQDRQVAALATPLRVAQVVASDRQIWAAGNTELVGFDPASEQEAARYRVPSHPLYDGRRMVLAVAEGILWWADRTKLYAIQAPGTED